MVKIEAQSYALNSSWLCHATLSPAARRTRNSFFNYVKKCSPRGALTLFGGKKKMKRTIYILLTIALLAGAFVALSPNWNVQSPVERVAPEPTPMVSLPTPTPEPAEPVVWEPRADAEFDALFFNENYALGHDTNVACDGAPDKLADVAFDNGNVPEWVIETYPAGMKLNCQSYTAWQFCQNATDAEICEASVINALRGDYFSEEYMEEQVEEMLADNGHDNLGPESTATPEATITPDPTAVPAEENTESEVQVTDDVTGTVGFTNTVTVSDPRFTLVIPETPIKETNAIEVLSPMEKAAIRLVDTSGNYNQTALGTERFIGDAGVFLSSDVPTPDGAWALDVNAYELNFAAPAYVNVVEGGFMWFNGKYGTLEVNGMTATCHDYERNNCFIVVYNPEWDHIIDTDFNLQVTVTDYNPGFVQIQRFPAGTVLSEDYFIGNVNRGHQTNSNGFDGASATTMIFLNSRTGESTVLEHMIGSELPVSLFANFDILQPIPNS
jgi:hypothetical protein